MADTILPLSFEDFGDWLAKKPAEQEFPKGTCTSCPLAQFIRSKTGGLVTVTFHSIWLEKNGREVREDLPAWAREFVQGIAATAPLTVSHCIQALSRVTAPIFPRSTA